MTYSVICHHIIYDGIYDCNVVDRERKYDRNFKTKAEALDYIIDPPRVDEGILAFEVEEE